MTMLRIYRKKYLKSKGMDEKIIDVTLRKDLDRLQDYMDHHKCMNYYEAEHMLLDFWESSENKKDNKYKYLRVLMKKANLNVDRILGYWENRNKEN